MKIDKLKDLKALIELLKAQKVDILELEGLKIVISRHDYPLPKKKEEKVETEDDILFYHENY